MATKTCKMIYVAYIDGLQYISFGQCWTECLIYSVGLPLGP